MLSIRTAVAFATLALAPLAAPAQNTLIRVPLPNGSTFPISQGVWVGNTLYLSGMLDPDLGKTPVRDTKTQTLGAIQNIQKALAGQKLTLGDVVMMHVYLAPEPASGKMDFPGFMAAYSQFFGTKEQPNKPARSAMQVAALAAPTGLVEIEVIAVKP
ncbi:MAG: Endoribonuclease [Acidobacteriaceae bacterium]|nr:Endoribonuclease [Acidobacteriaceae bacterium]